MYSGDCVGGLGTQDLKNNASILAKSMYFESYWTMNYLKAMLYLLISLSYFGEAID